MDEAGQSALFDAFLFFVVALVASAAILAYTSLTLSESESEARVEALSYAEDVRETLMQATLNDPWYVNHTGAIVRLGPGITVEGFLLDELRLLAAGLPPENFAAMNLVILDMTKSLVRPPFSGGLGAASRGHVNVTELWLGDGTGPPSERFTASWVYETGDGNHVEIAVHLWYA